MNVIRKGILNATSNDPAGGDPSKIFKFIQDLESQGSDLARGQAKSDQQFGAVYKGVANELKDRLFAGYNSAGVPVPGAGADNVLASQVLTPENLQKLKDISPGLAQDVSQVQTIGQLRSLAKPFVRGQIAAEKSAERVSNSLLSVKDLGAAGVGGLVGGGPGAIAMGGLQRILESNAFNSSLGGALSRAGGPISSAGQNLSSKASSPLLQRIIGISGGVGAPSVAGQINQPQSNSNQSAPNQSFHDSTITPNSGGSQMPQQTTKISPQQVQMAKLLLPPQISDRIQAAYDMQSSPEVQSQNIGKTLDKLVEDYGSMNIIQRLNPTDPKNAGFQTAKLALAQDIERASLGRVNQVELNGLLNQMFPVYGSKELGKAQVESLKQHLRDTSGVPIQ